MNAGRVIPAVLVSAALAALASPAFAAGVARSANHYLALADLGYVPSSPIVVTESRATEDELITRGVVDSLAGDSQLAGRIGVETVDGVVSLSGIVTSPRQSRQAERDAGGVYGVRHVHNELATRIGGGKY
jgi:BON domain-containing protein